MANALFRDAANDVMERKAVGDGSTLDAFALYNLLQDEDGDVVEVSASGELSVLQAGSWTVSAICTNAGTFAVQAAQSGTWNITNISGTISLPTGASTESTLAALNTKVGTAGALADNTANPTIGGLSSFTMVFDGSTWDRWTGAVTVSSLPLPSGAATLAEQQTQTTSLQILDNCVYVDGTAFTLTSSSLAAVGGIRDDALSGSVGDAEGDVVPLRVDSRGALWVTVDGASIADDTAFTPGTSRVVMAGFEADEGSTDSVDEGDAGAARMTLDRKQIVTLQPHTGGGLEIARDLDLDNGTLTVVKNAPGQVYGWHITNRTTSPVYVKFYDATSGTLGTGTPVLTIEIPGNASDHTSLAQSFGGMGIEFETGISVGAGTGIADADNTDPGANAVLANIFYK